MSGSGNFVMLEVDLESKALTEESVKKLSLSLTFLQGQSHLLFAIHQLICVKKDFVSKFLNQSLI